MIKYNYADDYVMEETLKRDRLGKLLRGYGYECEISENPDYILHFAHNGDSYLRCDGIRISWTGEDESPDFNLVDYAIGFDYIEFGDRYYRHPLYLSYNQDWELGKIKHKKFKDINAENRKFCSFVYSNNKADSCRKDFFQRLSRYKKVDSGGRYLNNIGGKPVKDKLDFQKKYKFSIAFENASSPGYVTEKLVQSFAAGTIPIYWGDPMVAREFNTKAFINCNDYNSFDEVIERVRQIDEDDKLYLQYLSEPMCTDTQFNKAEQVRVGLDKFLLNIFQQPYEDAFRRKRGCRGKIYEGKMKRQLLELNVENMSLKDLIKFNLRYIKHKIVM